MKSGVSLLVWEGGSIDCTNWQDIKQKYWIEAMSEGKIICEKDIKNLTNRKQQGALRIHKVVKKNECWRMRIKTITKSSLKDVTTDDLIKCWRKREFLENKERYTIARRINKEIKKRLGKQLPTHLYLRVPEFKGLTKNDMEQVISRSIDNLELSKQWKKLIREETKIICIRNRTIGEMLLNYTSWAKDDWFKIHSCTCLDRNEGKNGGNHEIWKLEDLEKEMELLTTKTVIEPNGKREMQVFKDEVQKWINNLSHVTNKIKVKIPKIKYTNPEMESTIHYIQEKWKGWIFLERDKNLGSIAIACPMWYRYHLIKTYDWTAWRANYLRISKKDEDILSNWKNGIKEKGLDKLWNKKGLIPYCYGLPKEKDLGKMRPIVSYKKHPLKRLFNYVGKILCFMIKNSDIKSFTLWRTGDMTKVIEEANEMIGAWNKEEIEVKMMVYDVKEMYTNLPHQEIIHAVEWLIERFRERHGEWITITRNRMKDIKIGKKRGKSFNLSMIYETVKQDLNNAVFKCGIIPVIQTIGIPMGSPLSPSLAILTCAKAEHKMYTELRINTKFHAMRYMDDIWFMIMKNKRDESKEDLTDLFQNYSKKLKLEKEREGNRVRFLEREIIWDGEKLTERAFNKNNESLMKEGKRKFMNMLPNVSYGTRKMKRAIIIGRLIKIHVGTTIYVEKFWKGWLTLWEIGMLGYKWDLVKECCGWIDARFRDKIWRLLVDLFQMVGNNFMFSPFNFNLKGLKIDPSQLCESEVEEAQLCNFGLISDKINPISSIFYC